MGNITVGGTGKTPMCELLVDYFTQQYPVAILSRGYGRKSSGYREVGCDDSYLMVGDEPLQMKRKYPDTLVVVCEKRVDAINRIVDSHPEVKLIIMDDGFQHRYVDPKINIIMIDFTRPLYLDAPLPLGNLRDNISELERAKYFIVTKCPEKLTSFDIGMTTKEFVTTSHQKAFFTRIENLAPTPTFFDIAPEFDSTSEIIAMSGIGNPAPFLNMVEGSYDMVAKLTYPDHHSYNEKDILAISQLLESHPQALILTTEKDSVKFQKMTNLATEIKRRLYYTPIKMKFMTRSETELLNDLEYDIRND